MNNSSCAPLRFYLLLLLSLAADSLISQDSYIKYHRLEDPMIVETFGLLTNEQYDSIFNLNEAVDNCLTPETDGVPGEANKIAKTFNFKFSEEELATAGILSIYPDGFNLGFSFSAYSDGILEDDSQCLDKFSRKTTINTGVEQINGYYPILPDKEIEIKVEGEIDTCFINFYCPFFVAHSSHYQIDHFDNNVTINRPIFHTYRSDSAQDSSFFSVCADGTASSLFKFSLLGGYFGQYDAEAQNLQFRIKEDPDGSNAAQYGRLGHFNYVGHEFEVAYTHPTTIPTTVTTPYATYTLELYDRHRPEIVYKAFDLRVYRIPIVMVHGLWGKKTAFSKMENSLINSNQYSRAQLHRADYEQSNDASFSTNAYEVPYAIGTLKEELKSNGISCKKVNIVAHSMGGILARLYLQSTDYDDDIARLITMNTPHAGSQLANLLLDDNYDLSPLLRSVAYRFLGNPNGGAIEDLRVNSPAIRNYLNGFDNLNLNTVPTHAITSVREFPELDLLILLSGAPWFKTTTMNVIPFALQFIQSTSDDIENAFNNERHDWIVPLSSQYGNMPENSTYLGLIHTFIHKNTFVINDVRRLLNQPLDSDLFDDQGFHPPVLTYSTPSFQSTSLQLKKNLTENDLVINSPAQGSVYSANSPITVSISGNTDIEKILLFVSYGTDSVYVAQQMGATFNLTLEGDTIAGEKTIIAIAKTTTGNVRLKESTFSICPGGDNILNDQILSSGSFYAGANIFSNASIADGSQVNFIAGNAIILNPGFEAQRGTTVSMKIEPCGIPNANYNKVAERASLAALETSSTTKPSLNIFPNPFSGVANIHLQLEETGKVELSLVDLYGKKQRSIVREELASGHHEFAIAKQNLSTGIYFIQLQTKDTLVTKSVIIR